MASIASLSRQTIMACAAIALVVATLFAELAGTVRTVNEAGRSLDQARAVLDVAGDAERSLTRLETNVHGWEDTGAGSFIGDWLVTRDVLLRRMWTLRDLTSGDPRQGANVDRTFARIGAHLILHRPRTVPRRVPLAAYRARFARERRAQLDSVRRAFASVERLEQRSVRRRQAAQRATARRALALGIAGTVVAVVLVAALAAYLVLAVIAPIRRLGGFARHLRDGELDARASASGHPEVAAVADTMNAMAAALDRDRRELRRSEARFREAFAHAPTGMSVTELDGRYVEVNEALCQITGRSREELLALRFHDVMHPDDLAVSEEARAAIVRGELERWRTEKRYLRPDGVAVTVWQHVSVVRDDHGRPVRFLSQVVDVTEQRRAEAAATAADRRFASAFANAPVGMGLVSLEGRFVEVNEALSRITGYPKAELEASSPVAITHPEDVEATRVAMAELLEGEAEHLVLEKRCLHAGGHPVDVALHLSLVRDEAGRPAHFLSQVIDVTDRKRFEAQLRHMADHDPLTGLLNRRSFEPELERQCVHVTRYGPEGALIVLDVDHFKQINDTLGHNAGDEVIVEIGAILRSRLRETDVLARLGGDEFAILLPKADRAQAELVAQALVDAVRTEASARNGERRRRITISVGVALLEEAGRTAEEALVDADLAMYDAKEAGRDGYAVFDPERYAGSRAKARGQWVERIEEAIEEDGFVLHAQPILDLHSGEIGHHELLLRMRDDHGDLIPPAAFLFVAERYGLISRIDRWVVGRAVALVAAAEAAGTPRRLAVNLSGTSVGDAELLQAIEADLHRTGIDPSGLVFEMTEAAAVADIARARRFAEGIAALGCRFALDDFGAGFGSFYYLKHLPFDYLKIDGEFVAKCLTTRTDQLVIEAVVGIAQGLGKETVAEFVPDARTRRMLSRLGVDHAQGEHVGMPVPLEQALGPLVAA